MLMVSPSHSIDPDAMDARSPNTMSIAEETDNISDSEDSTEGKLRNASRLTKYLTHIYCNLERDKLFSNDASNNLSWTKMNRLRNDNHMR